MGRRLERKLPRGMGRGILIKADKTVKTLDKK